MRKPEESMENALNNLWINYVLLTVVTMLELVVIYGIAREVRRGNSILDNIEGRTRRIAEALNVTDH
jgi:hypothetical protein